MRSGAAIYNSPEMIRSFRHKGIERFFLTGSKAGIQPGHAARLRDRLAALNAATKPEHMDIPGWKFHALGGSLAGHWAVSVNANWRLTFTFVEEDAVLVDYQDYH